LSNSPGTADPPTPPTPTPVVRAVNTTLGCSRMALGVVNRAAQARDNRGLCCGILTNSVEGETVLFGTVYSVDDGVDFCFISMHPTSAHFHDEMLGK
jgi:hypothetical protein